MGGGRGGGGHEGRRKAMGNGDDVSLSLSEV